MVKIELSKQEAEQFKDWRKYQDQFEVLWQAGVFHTTNGKAIINFDCEGSIVTIGFDFIGWKRRA